MRATLAIARRELDAYFTNPIGWICLCGFLVITGLFFVVMLAEFSYQATQAAFNPMMADQMNINEWLLPAFFGNWAVILLFACPALAMRIFAEDFKQHSFELLLSSPVSSAQIVLGKYLGALGFIAVLFGMTIHYPLVLYWLGTPDPGVLASSYLAEFLIAATFMAVGMFTSSLTENQIVAYITSFGFLMVLWVFSWLESIGSGQLWTVLSQVSMLSHLEQLTKGLLKLSDAVYFLSFIGLFLYATLQRVEALRWR